MLKNFTSNVSETLGVFADALLSEDSNAKTIEDLDVQIKNNLETIRRYPAQARLYSTIVESLV